MKKIIFILLLAITLSLTSCHGAKHRDAFTIPESFDISKSYEISFWAKNDTNQTQVNIYKKAIEDFQTIYPNIKVNLRLYTDYGRIYQDVLTNIATGTTPNVCITYPDHIATYMTGENNVVPLTALFEDEKYGLGGNEVAFDAPTKDEIIPKFLEECKLGTDYYAVPYMRSTEACYVNKTYVEKLGYTLPETLTWDFVWEVSEAAMAKDAEGNFIVNGQKTMIPFIYKSTDNMMISMLRQLDAPYSTSRGEILLFNDTTKSLLLEIAEHADSRAFCTFKLVGYPANFLNAGQCIFAIDSTGGATWMGSDAPLVDIPEENMVDFETEVMTIPQFDTNAPQMISQGPSMCIFNKEDPQEVLASWLFMQFMLTNEVQIAYSQTEGYIPVTSKAQNSPEYEDYLSREGEDNDFYYDIKIKAAKLMIDNTENSFTTAVFNGSTSLRDAAGQLVENVTKSIRRHQTVNEEYIDTLYEDMTSLYHLDNTELSAGTISHLTPLPLESKLLISAICTVWALILIFLAVGIIKKRKNS